jgi:hypothetical protein
VITDPPPRSGEAADTTSGEDQHLEVVVEIDANTLAFGGSIQTDVGLRDLLGGVPPDAAPILAWVPNIAIEQAGFYFDPNAVRESFTVFVVAGIPGSATSSANLFIATVPTPLAAVGVAAPQPDATSYVVGLRLTSSVDLGATPLFGSMLRGIAVQALSLDYASHALPENSFTLPPPAPRHQPAFPEGLVLTLTIAAGGAERTFRLRPSTKPPPNTPALDRSRVDVLANEPGDDQPVIQWFSVQKSFGPLTLGRIGLLTTDKQLGLGLDASVATSAFSVVLTGFTVTFPTDRIDVSATRVQLDGLALNFSSPSVSIAGSLVRRECNELTEYNGAVLIQVGAFGVAAVGSFADLHGSPSLFIYGMVKGAFGGPPAFFVTGLAAGFGYNRSLRLPAFGTVADHPFILASKEGADFTKALAMLAEGGWVPPSAGDYWLAAGIQFTSFEVVRSFALVSVQFGHELVFSLLGISALRLPQVGPTYAYAELTIDAVLRPLEGTFQLTALLTANSFVLDPACHLQGGFAFWLWFGDTEHAGDFVVTLGGYHPLFEPPPWYPTLPRLGFAWNMGQTVHVTGGAYFALTPSCVMAGGSLALTFHEGDLRAWFTAHVDMLVFWKPFYFVVAIGVSIGVSYTLNLGALSRTFRVELGVDVDLWGPPVAGVAHVSWWVISFTVDINGGGRPNPPGRTLKDWDTFAASFLPAAPSPSTHLSLPAAPPAPVAPEARTPICRPRVARGLLRTIDDGRVWIIAASELVLGTETVIPATDVLVGDPEHPAHRFSGPAVGVYPMGSVNLEARHLVSLVRVVGEQAKPVELSSWNWEAVAGNQPQSLWGRQNAGHAELGADTVPVLTGSTGTPAPVELSGPGPISFGVLRYADLPDRSLPLPTTPPIDGATTPFPDPFAVIEATVMDPAVMSTRDAIVAELERRGVGMGLGGGDLSLLRDEVRATFAAPPMIGPLGSTGPHPTRARERGAARPSGRPRSSRPRWRPTEPVVRRAFRRQLRGTTPSPLEARFPKVGPMASLLRSAADGGILVPMPQGERVVRSGAIRATGRAASVNVAPDITVVWEVDPTRRHTVELRGPERRVLACDDQHQPLFDAVLGGAVDLPAGAALVVVDELGVPSAPVGWMAGARLRKVGPQLAMGEGVLVRTQAPVPTPRRRRRAPTRSGLVTAAALMADNAVAGYDPGDSSPGWVDTIVPAGMRTALVGLTGPGHNAPRVGLLTFSGRGRPHPSGIRRDVEPAASLTDADGVHLLVDLVPTGEITHFFVVPNHGWRVNGVAAFAEEPPAVLTRDPSRELAEVDVPSTTVHEPTLVVWR